MLAEVVMLAADTSALTTLPLRLKPAPFSVLALVMLPNALMVPPVMPGPTRISWAVMVPVALTMPVLTLPPLMLAVVVIVLDPAAMIPIMLPPVMLPLPDTAPVTFNPVVVTTTTLLTPLIEIFALPALVPMFTSELPL